MVETRPVAPSDYFIVPMHGVNSVQVQQALSKEGIVVKGFNLRQIRDRSDIEQAFQKHLDMEDRVEREEKLLREHDFPIYFDWLKNQELPLSWRRDPLLKRKYSEARKDALKDIENRATRLGKHGRERTSS